MLINLSLKLSALLCASRFYVEVDVARASSEGQGQEGQEREGQEREREEREVGVTIITPENVEERGAQLSLVFLPTGRGVMPRVLKGLEARGVVGDSRKPDVIRLAPAPLYNTFEDVERAVSVLEEVRFLFIFSYVF